MNKFWIWREGNSLSRAHVSFVSDRILERAAFWITTRASDSDFVLVILRTPSANQNFVWRENLNLYELLCGFFYHWHGKSAKLCTWLLQNEKLQKLRFLFIQVTFHFNVFNMQSLPHQLMQTYKDWVSMIKQWHKNVMTAVATSDKWLELDLQYSLGNLHRESRFGLGSYYHATIQFLTILTYATWLY